MYTAWTAQNYIIIRSKQLCIITNSFHVQINHHHLQLYVTHSSLLEMTNEKGSIKSKAKKHYNLKINY
jgi:hypothetical protein